jgi:hypothetical protein
MKILILSLSLVFSFQVLAKQNVLLIFPKLENLSLTGRLTSAGVDIAYQ